MRAVLCLLLLSACGDDSGSADMAPDMTVILDLSGADYGGVPGCLDIAKCVQGIGTDMKCSNPMCVAACGMKSTQQSYMLYIALQNCYDQYCPKQSDMASPICAGALTGMPSQACADCVFDTRQADTSTCNNPGSPACRACYAPAQACIMDPM